MDKWRRQITFKMQKSGESLSKAAIHMDCFAWVNRDSYLPQGSRGLKVRRLLPFLWAQTKLHGRHLR